MIDLLRREPALTAAALNALIAVGLVFGLHLSVEQIAAIMALANALIAVLVRSQVTPTVKARKPRAPSPDQLS